jgi:MFS transporter, CP family, cyanate transporter
MRPNHVVGRNAPPYRVLVPARPLGAGLHRAAQRPPAGGVPVGGARLALSLSVLVSIPLLALNLRPAVTSVGAVLADIRAASGMSAVLASVVVAAPVWCFALGGGLAYKLRAAWGTSRTVTLALVMLAATLATRVIAGPYLLLAGTVLACLSIAVLGTLLPVITHAAPTKAWALLTGCYVAAMGGGSGLGALITPQVSGRLSWQWGVSAWALLAAAALVAWRVAARRFSEPAVAAGPRPSPFTLRPPTTAWSTTLHFGLTSGFTFTIMGWLPSILLDHSHVDATMVGWMFGVAMALGVPIALMVPKWARASQSQSGLAVVLCVPNMLAMAGLLLYPEITPWVWAISLGLGMPAVGLGLTLISLRAAPDGDTAAALSSMVQGFGYAIAGATALGAGLLHSSTQGWEWPLIGLLAVLCGQLITGMHAGLPTTVYSGRRFAPSVERPEPRRSSGRAAFPQATVPWPGPGGGPLQMSGPGVGWGPPGAPPVGSVPFPGVRMPGGSGPRPFPSPRRGSDPVPELATEPVLKSAETAAEAGTQAVEPVGGSVSRVLDAPEVESDPAVASAADETQVVSAASVTQVVSAASVASLADGAEVVSEVPGVPVVVVAGSAVVAEPVPAVDGVTVVASVVAPAEPVVSSAVVAGVGVAEPEVVAPVAETEVVEPVGVAETVGVTEPAVTAGPGAEVTEAVGTTAIAGPVAESVAERVAEPVAGSVAEQLAEPVAGSVVEPVAGSVVESIVEPVARSVVEPVVGPVAEPVAEPAIEAVVESVVERVAEPVAESVVERVAEPVVGSVAEPVAEPVVGSVAEPVAEPVVGSVAESVVEPVAEQLAEPVAESVVGPVAEPVAEPAIEAVVESVADGVPSARSVVVVAGSAVVPEPVPAVTEVTVVAGAVTGVEASEVAVPEPVVDSPETSVAPEPEPQPVSEPTATMIEAQPNGHFAAAAEEDELVRLTAPRQEALFAVPEQEALFEIPLPRQPLV